eukprot:359264-Chlamydomonas_euryale.AAC.3
MPAQVPGSAAIAQGPGLAVIARPRPRLKALAGNRPHTEHPSISTSPTVSPGMLSGAANRMSDVFSELDWPRRGATVGSASGSCFGVGTSCRGSLPAAPTHKKSAWQQMCDYSLGMHVRLGNSDKRRHRVAFAAAAVGWSPHLEDRWFQVAESLGGIPGWFQVAESLGVTSHCLLSPQQPHSTEYVQVLECALDRQAWQDAIKNLAPLQLQKPQQVGRMTRSCARRGGIGNVVLPVSGSTLIQA